MFRTAPVLVMAVLACVLSSCPLKFNSVRPSSDPAVVVPRGTPGSWEQPIRCDGASGERAYLDQLRGPDGRPVHYRRLGNAGTGVNGNIVDVWLVESQDGTVQREVIMDMYYEGVREKHTVDGFSLHLE